jgi:hypothetical protein
MFVPEHKHPLMSTRNRLHEFLVDDACAQGAPACSGREKQAERCFLPVFCRKKCLGRINDRAEAACSTGSSVLYLYLKKYRPPYFEKL